MGLNPAQGLFDFLKWGHYPACEVNALYMKKIHSA
jgi:hypothetical protein